MADSNEYYEARIAALKAEIVRLGADLAVVAKPENIFYYSGFNPVLNSHRSFVVVPAEGEATLLVHSIRGDHAKEESWLERIECHGKWGDRVAVAADPHEAAAAVFGGRAKKLALELDFLPVTVAEKLRAAFGGAGIADFSAFADHQRNVKDPTEIERLRASAAMADEAMVVMIAALRSGATEAEASTAGQHAMRLLWQKSYSHWEVAGFGGQEGGIIDALNCWVLTDRRIAYGCDCPRQIKALPGRLVLPMVWAKLGGYHAENERTLACGDLDDFKRLAYDAMLRARENVFAALKPGNTYENLYLEGVRAYEDAGFSSILPGRIGHGIGLSAHEHPSLQKGNKTVLEPGMVFTVEPGLMAASWGGVRHADTILITENGYESLTRTDRGTLSL